MKTHHNFQCKQMTTYHSAKLNDFILKFEHTCIVCILQ